MQWSPWDWLFVHQRYHNGKFQQIADYQERGCFFNDEIKMVNCNADVGCRYEFSNCLFEAYTDKVRLSIVFIINHLCTKVRSECECDTVFWSMPEADNVCKGENLNCVRQLIILCLFMSCYTISSQALYLIMSCNMACHTIYLHIIWYGSYQKIEVRAEWTCRVIMFG